MSVKRKKNGMFPGSVILSLLIVLFISLPVSASEEVKYVALTLDDGPSVYMAPLLNELKERDAHVTFFLTGWRVNPYKAVVERAYDEGHQIANHDYSHADLSLISADDINKEIDSTNVLLTECTGESSFMVRPPWGYYNDTTLSTRPNDIFIGWNIDTYDWAIKDSADCTERILSADDGDIILMHITVGTTPKGIIDAIDIMQKDGYRFVTVEELAKIKGVDLQPGTYYKKFKGENVTGVSPKDPYAFDESKIEDYWAYDDLKMMEEHQWMKPSEDGLYLPEHPCTRGMLAVVLYRMFSTGSGVEEIPFEDVKAGTEKSAAISWCVTSGLMTAPEDGLFHPGDSVTREGFCAALYALGISRRVTMDIQTDTEYIDNSLIDDWAVDAVKGCTNAKVISGRQGKPGLCFDPQKYITRVEVASALLTFNELDCAAPAVRIKNMIMIVRLKLSN